MLSLTKNSFQLQKLTFVLKRRFTWTKSGTEITKGSL